MHFGMKNTLKNSRNHTFKQALIIIQCFKFKFDIIYNTLNLWIYV